MSNDSPDKKKGLLSGLGNIFKAKGEGSSVPESEVKAPALRPPVQAVTKTEESVPPPVPVAVPVVEPKTTPAPAPKVATPGRAQHFRDEFEVFLSDKQNKGQSSAAPGSAKAPYVSQSRKPQVVKSADLSKEFEFFTKSSRPKNQGSSAAPVQGITAKPPVLSSEVKQPPSVVATPSVSVSASKSEVPALVPPPPPRIEQKPAPLEQEKPKAASPLTPPTPASVPAPKKDVTTPVAVPATAPTAVTPALPKPVAVVPEVPAAKPPVVEVKTTPPPTITKPASAAPADIFAPRPKAVPAAPVKAPEVQAKPAPVIPPPAAVPVEKKAEAAKIAVPTLSTPSVSVPSVTPVTPVTPVTAASRAPTSETKAGVPVTGKKSIKKVELDPKRRKRPVVVLPPVGETGIEGTPSNTQAGEKKKRGPVLAWAGALIVLLLLGGIGFYIYQITRETTFEATLLTDDLVLTGTPMVIYNFDGQVSQIKRDYAERRGPMEVRLQEIEADLASAKADLAGREEKKRLLTGEIQKLRNSIPLLVGESEKKLERLWKEEGGGLDKAYSDQKDALHKEIEKRAKDLGLKYERNQELDALEVAVNAFRLSLYGAPKTVNVDEQRLFSEDILKRWRDYEKEWAKQQLAIKEKAMVIKQSPGPAIEVAQKQIENLKVDLDALNIDLASLQEEVNRRQQDEVEEQEKLREVEKPFLSDLMKIPGNNILRELKPDLEGKYLLRNLEKSTDMPPGDYLFFVQAKKGDETFWAIKTFTISAYKKTELQVSRQDFVSIHKLIQ